MWPEETEGRHHMPPAQRATLRCTERPHTARGTSTPPLAGPHGCARRSLAACSGLPTMNSVRTHSEQSHARCTHPPKRSRDHPQHTPRAWFCAVKAPGTCTTTHTPQATRKFCSVPTTGVVSCLRQQRAMTGRGASEVVNSQGSAQDSCMIDALAPAPRSSSRSSSKQAWSCNSCT
jgi:hypothetical protein